MPIFSPPIVPSLRYDAVRFSHGHTLGMCARPIPEWYAQRDRLGVDVLADALLVRDLVAHGGVNPNDAAFHAMLLVLLDCLHGGGVCVPMGEGELESCLCMTLPGVEGDAASSLASTIRNAVKDGRWGDIVGRGGTFSPVIHDEGFLYFQRYYHYERVLADAMTRRLQTAAFADGGGVAEVAPLLTAMHNHFPLNDQQRLAACLALGRKTLIISGGPGTGKTSIIAAVLQLMAQRGVTADEVALTAPTGRAAQQMADAIRQASVCMPDDEVFQTLARNVRPMTLHRLLGCVPGNNRVRYHAARPLRHRVLVVDEASMIDLCMMTRLLDATPLESTLLLLGDRDQLPSVDAGQVLAGLIPACPCYSAQTVADAKATLGISLSEGAPAPLRDSVVMLEKTYRCEPRIRTLADRINTFPDVANDADAARQDIVAAWNELSFSEGTVNWPAWSASDVTGGGFAEGACWRASLGSSIERRTLLESWLLRHYVARPVDADIPWPALVRRMRHVLPESIGSHTDTLDALFSILAGGRLLSILRRGPDGCDALNRELMTLYGEHMGMSSRHNLFSGLPVMVTRNDRGRRIYNGDVGVVLRLGASEYDYGGLFVCLHTDEGYVLHPVEAVSETLEPAFAMTVHKSQGSAYREVLFWMPTDAEACVEMPSLFTREMVYTALTRAKQLAIIAGSDAVFDACVQRRVQRPNGLASRMAMLWDEGNA